ncbi:MAG: winged helix-turn-helix transcriptional regulator [Caldilineaceae bacterium]
MSEQSRSEQSSSVENELQLLEALAVTPETTQADLAVRAGIAVGTVNWYLKRWSKKGYIKVRRIDRWKWSYLLTSEGIARKAKLAGEYIEASLALYRQTRTEAKRLLQSVQNAGQKEIIIDDASEIADICRLTCLEMNIAIVADPDRTRDVPVLQIEGAQLSLLWPQPKSKPS